MKKPIDEIIPISLPVGAGFMGSVFGYSSATPVALDGEANDANSRTS